MTIRIVALAALLAFCCVGLVACGGGDPAKAMQGKWSFDTAAAEKKIDADAKMKDEEKKMAKGFLAMMAAMTMEITADTIKMGDSSMTYKITKTEGNKLTIETTDKDGTKKSGIMEVSGDTLTMIEDGKDEGMPFKRAK